MKTINFKTATVAIVFAFSFLFANKSFSQTPSCPFLINSSIQCSVVVTVNFYDNSSTTPCSTTQVTITPANNPVSVGCGSCNSGALTNVQVILDFINGATITTAGSFVDKNNTSASGTINSPCNFGDNTWSMSWTSNGVDIGY